MAGKFSDNFWGGFDILCDRVYTQAKETSKELAGFLDERAKVEKSYAKDLTKLANYNMGTKEIGSLHNALNALRGDMENTALHHTRLAEKLSQDLSKQVNKFKDDQKATKKNLISSAKKAAAEVEKARNLLNSAKKKYESANRDAENAEGKAEVAQRNRNDADLKKWSKKAEDYNKLCVSTEKDYREAVARLRTTHRGFEESMASVFDQFQKLEEARLDMTKNVLKAYVKELEGLGPLITGGCKILNTVVGQVDRNADIALFIHENRTGNTRGEQVEFVAYPRKRRDFSGDSGFAAPAGGGGGGGGGGSGSAKGGSSRRKGAAKKLTARSLYPYEAGDSNELSFPAGAVITILDQDDSGWWQGEYKGKRGLFPSNYTEPI